MKKKKFIIYIIYIMKPIIKKLSMGLILSLVILTLVSYNVKFRIAQQIVKISKQLNKTKLKIYDYGCGSGDFLKDIEIIIKMLNPNIKLDVYGYDIINYNKYYKCSTKLSRDNYDIKLCSYCIHHIQNHNHSEVIKYMTTNSIYTIFIEDERMSMYMCKKHLRSSGYISKYRKVENQFYKKKEFVLLVRKYCYKIIYCNTIYFKLPFQKSHLLKDIIYYNPTNIIITKN
jgi:hypothetical protein